MTTPQGDINGSVFEWAGTSGPLTAREALEEVVRVLREWAIPPEDIQTCELVLAEAINNVIEHACRDLKNICVSLSLKRLPACLDVTIRDAGHPMPGLDLSSTRHRRVSGPDVDVAPHDLPEGGFGWFLIYDLTESVEYERIGDSNLLKLSVPIATQS